MKKILFFTYCSLLLLCVFPTKTEAEEWIDVTTNYIKNPSFDNNTNQYWIYTSNASSQTVRVGCMEFWSGTFDFYQQLHSLKKGKYRLSLQSYYRCEDNNAAYNQYYAGNEQITAYLYAANKQQQIKSVYSYAFNYNAENSCWTPDGKNYFPNTMESANAAFEKGAYLNTLEFNAEGDISIGIKNETNIYSNWCIFDNFKLEYWGTRIYAQSIAIEAPITSLVKGEKLQLKAKITPDDATVSAITWTSDHQDIINVDNKGIITALKDGTARITAHTTDGTNLQATTTFTVSTNPPTTESLIINEIMTANVDEYISPTFNFESWIELYNPTTVAVSLGGIYLSDDASNLKKWKTPDEMGIIPAKGYKIIWFDNNNLSKTNADLKLDTDGGYIYISNTNGKLICSQQYPSLPQRTAYARTTDGNDIWALTANPTPAKSNNTTTYATSQIESPIVDKDDQLFEGTLNISVNIPQGATLRYTTDGTLPTLNNGATSSTGLFSIDKTTIFRFRLFKNNYLPSQVTTRSYIYNNLGYEGGILSIVSDPRFLYDDSIGVYVQGVNGKKGNGMAVACNWNMEWDRPVNFAYITKDNTAGINQDVDLEMAGGWSRAWTPHSVKLKGTKEYGGNKNLDYPFFSAKPFIRNRTLQVRNGGNDNTGRIKDPILETIIQTSGIDIDLQSYQPVHEFINGAYIGVLNIREPNNKHYVYANYGWDDDEIDQFEMSPDSGYIQKTGTYETFDALYNLTYNASDHATYQEIKNHLDIDEYINYMAMQFYLGSNDWPRNNIKGFSKTDGGKFRMISFDLDGAFGYSQEVFNEFDKKKIWTFDELYDHTPSRITKEIELVTIFQNLLKNEEFKHRFIDTYCIMEGSVFEPKRSEQIIDSLLSIVGPMMAIKNESPYNSANTVKKSLNNRQLTMINALKAYSPMQLENRTIKYANIKSNINGAILYLNEMPIPMARFDGYLFNGTVIKAEEPAGYTFKGWKTSNSSKKNTIISNEDTWTYYDNGTQNGTTWTTADYNVSNWKQGQAPLGYGNHSLNTVINYGYNTENKYPTYYFRHLFTLDKAPTSENTFKLNFTVDDGFIVYINGREAARYNMPTGTINFNTYSSTYAKGNPDAGTIALPYHLLKKGNNIIAVEVHNNSGSSSDIVWDAALESDINAINNDNYYATTKEIIVSEELNNIIACYEPQDDNQLKEQGIHPVRINEVSASNSIYINDYFKKNDWIELYNTTSKDINIAGMYLSDDSNNKKKYKIIPTQNAASTMIPAHGYKLIWCDKMEQKSMLHATFKLAGEGGHILLTSADETWTDTIAYPAHDGNTTVGRYPDGCNEVYVLNVPTIGKNNLKTTYAVNYKDNTGTGLEPVNINHSSELSIAYINNQLIIRNEEAQRANVTLYNVSGEIAMQCHTQINRGKAIISIAPLHKGTYIATANDNEGNKVSIKIIK